MKKRLYFSILGFLLLYGTPKLAAQTVVKIMPLGDSITWGKINKGDPPAGTEGYRKPLYEKLAALGLTSVSFEFVGGMGTAPYYGFYKDGATIKQLDSTMTVANIMALSQPKIVILHIGTNNLDRGMSIGDYNTPNTMMNHLYNLVTKITDAATVNYLLLCKIIPNYTTPGSEIETANFNNALEIMVNQLNAVQKSKVTVIDMWTPFNSNKLAYYNYEMDKVHPNSTGYTQMAEIFKSYIYNLPGIKPQFTDEFNGSGANQHVPADWVLSSGVQIAEKGEAGGGGALTYTNTSATEDWDGVAVWKKSKGQSTISMKFSNETANTDLHSVGILVGLDAASTTADGYLIWVHYNQELRIMRIVNGKPYGDKLHFLSGFPLFKPGDVFTISYRNATDKNYFIMQVNNNAKFTMFDEFKYAGNGTDLYSGILFRRSPGPSAYNYFVDRVVVESQLPDISAPGRIYNLANFSGTNTSLTFTWTAVGNDEYVGQAASYDFRYSSTPILNEADFTKANIISGLPLPKETGNSEIYTLSGLQSGIGYYFVMRAVDNWGNKGALSDPVYAKTTSSGEVVDTFDYPPKPDGSVGDDWLIDTNEYKLEYNTSTKEGELTNFQTDGAWGRLAVYRGRTNPSMVRLVWGRNATSEGIAQGGLALMLTSASLTADGYLLWVRSNMTQIYLYQIDNGVPAAMVDVVPYTLKDLNGNIRLPQNGDTLSVIMDWNYASGYKFDIYLNGKQACDRSMFDQNFLVSNVSVKYSGIMLGRRNKTNNVTAFITTAEKAGPAPLKTYPDPFPPTFGTVGTTITDSLRVIVLDANQTPMQGVPVFFSLMNPLLDAYGSLSAAQVPVDQIHIESEWGVLGGTYSMRKDDPGASGEAYIVAPAGDPGSGTATYDFYSAKDTTYNFYARVVSTGDRQYAVTIKVDNDAITWNFFRDNGNNSNGWNWERVDFGKQLRLGKGMHRIVLTKAHNNLKIDKLILYPSFTTPTGKGYLNHLLTRANGIAATAVTLSRKVGTNYVTARAYGNPDTVLFRIHGRPDVPTAMQMTNNNQSGAARDTLHLPLIVTVLDQYTNPVPNVIVNFTRTSGDGKILAAKDTTDNAGKASTRFVLGIESTSNKVRAAVTAYPAVLPVDFTATTSSGTVSKVQPIKVSIPGKHYIGQVLPNFVKVQVFDSNNRPISDVNVTFQVAKGPGTVGTQPKKTDSQGYALDTLKLGNTAGIVRVFAKVGTVQDTVVRDSVYYKGAVLQYYSGNNPTDTAVPMINDTLQNRLRVKVTDNAVPGRAIENHPVKFYTKGNGFRFLNGADSIQILTNSSGIASTNVRVGPVCGKYDKIIEVKSTDGFYPLTGSPIYFNTRVKSNATALLKISKDSLTGIVGTLLKDPIIVKMIAFKDTILNGKLTTVQVPVVGQPVSFTIKSGGGQFEGTLLPSVNVMTDGDGFALIYYNLGSVAGTLNNLVEVSATNGISYLLMEYNPVTGKYDKPMTFHFSAQSSAADSMRAVSSTTLSGTVGKPLAQPVQVLLTDEHGNVISGAEVKFSVIKGGGALGGTADTTTTFTVPNSGGIASIAWTLGSKAGTLNNELQVSANNGIYTLRGSPIIFKASGVPDTVSTSKSTITATTPVQATGKDTCWVTVTLMDIFGNPVPGKRVRLEVTGSGLNFKSDPTLPTNAQGKTKGFILSTTAGNKGIQAVDVDDNVRLKTTANVIFTPDGAYKMQAYSGDGQTGNAGTVLKDSLVVKIMDQFDNPVAFGPVKFEIISGGGRILGSQNVYSNANGLASVRIVLGTNPGDNVLKATAQVLIGKEAFFSAKAVSGAPKSMRPISSLLLTGPAGEELSNPFITLVTDASSNPVAGVSVLYKIFNGKGVITTAQPSKTNEYGYALCNFKTDTVAGNRTTIEASSVSLAGSPTYFTVTSTAGAARKIRYVSGDLQSEIVGQTLPKPLLVKAADIYGNGVSGISIQFKIISGNATINGGQSADVLSDGSGQAGVALKLGNKVGLILVQASNPLLQGSPVEFTVNATTLVAANIEKFRGDNQKGRVGLELVDPLYVRVLDEYGNGVPGVSIFFTKDANSGGSILEPLSGYPAVSDSNGIAWARFRAANAPGKSTINAMLYADKVVTFTVETVVNYNNPELNKNLINDQYDVAEGNQLLIPFLASDVDNQPLTFQIADLFPPQGMLIYSQTPTSAYLQWTPGYDQSGSYRIKLRVIDGFGGSDQDTIRINVINVDRPPEKVAAYPMHQDTTLTGGKKYTFWVNYRDLDSDVLHYVWKVDGVTMGSNLPVFQYTETSGYSIRRTIDAFVSDGVVTQSQRWNVMFLQPIDKVSMSAMAARFDQNNSAVTICWSTSSETHNLGFDILRSGSEKGMYQKMNTELIQSQKSGQYIYTDASIQAGQNYYYKIVDIDAFGNRNENGPLMIVVPKPDKFALMQNYPNPFNPTTTIRYNVDKKERVYLSVFNMLGQRVAVLADRIHEPGFYTISWDGRDESGKQTATGIYLYRLESGSQVQVLRMLKLQ